MVKIFIIKAQSSLSTLILDFNGLFQVGGWLRNSKEPYGVKFPIVLPKGTRLIILDCHLKPIQTFLSILRWDYWPINGKNAIRSVLLKCITYYKIKPFMSTQKMVNLPQDNVATNHAFSICSVDYAGPFHVKIGKLRNRAIVKGYMCLFLCFVSRAVHIQLASDLSTSTFLNCLKRFIS